jgi:hypothetical protein
MRPNPELMIQRRRGDRTYAHKTARRKLGRNLGGDVHYDACFAIEGHDPVLGLNVTFAFCAVR